MKARQYSKNRNSLGFQIKTAIKRSGKEDTTIEDLKKEMLGNRVVEQTPLDKIWGQKIS